MGRRVAFLSAHVKHYRLPFFEALYEALQADDIEMRVVYGTANSKHAERRDNVSLPATYGRKVPSFWIADRAVYHFAWREIVAADLVITPNENKLLLNPLLLAMRAVGMKNVAFWGKGTIAPAALTEPGEWARFHTANAVDWWFAYTASSSRNLRARGVTCGTTATGNAIDTTQLRRDIAAISPDCLRNTRASMGIGFGPVGVFCGNLSANKHLDLLFAAAKLIHDSIPEFSLLMIGNGPEREYVERVAAHERYIRYAGPRIGAEKALLLKMADVFLLPGAVGLAILDSFAAGLPLLTTDLSGHGPEISYLEDGHSGLITAHDPQTYADAVIGLLRNRPMLAKLRAGATESGYQYGIENMVQNFRRGILSCLEVQRQPRA
jgi:L-malate glycosyltransferase